MVKSRMIFCWLNKKCEYLYHKSFFEITNDIMGYFNNKIKKQETIDQTHKWIGTYNGIQMVYSTF